MANTNICLRLQPADLERLIALSARTGLSKSHLMRWLIHNVPVDALPNFGER